MKRLGGLLRIAIVGAGTMAREHIRAFGDVPGVALAGIHSRTRARAEALAAEFGVPGVYDSVADLSQATGAELAVVTVDETSMSEVSQTCCGYPWTVLLEKPPGLSVSVAEEIGATARANGRRVLVALNRRCLSSTRAIIADLDGRDGPRFIVAEDQQDQGQAKALGHPEVVVRRWMYANSIHVIDYLRLLGRGKITAVTPVVVWNPEEPGPVVARVDFDSGDVGLYQGMWHGPGPWAVSVTTRERRWELRPLEQAAFQDQGQRQRHPVEIHPWDRQFKPGLRLQAEMAVAAARGRPSDVPTLDEATETMRLIQAIFEP